MLNVRPLKKKAVVFLQSLALWIPLAQCFTRRGAFVYVKVSGSAAQCFTRRGAFVHVNISGLAAQYVYPVKCFVQYAKSIGGIVERSNLTSTYWGDPSPTAETADDGDVDAAADDDADHCVFWHKLLLQLMKLVAREGVSQSAACVNLSLAIEFIII